MSSVRPVENDLFHQIDDKVCKRVTITPGMIRALVRLLETPCPILDDVKSARSHLWKRDLQACLCLVVEMGRIVNDQIYNTAKVLIYNLARRTSSS